MRYEADWTAPFRARVQSRLRGGMTVLDIGGGRHPALPPGDRPAGTTYIGLDPSADELAAAPSGSYDLVFATSAEEFVPELSNRVDLAVSWQVFEHFSSLSGALGNLRDYVRPTGTLVSLFSGRWSAFGLLNRLLPGALAEPLVDRVMRRTAAGRPIFPAYYDACYASALQRLTTNWSAVEITPLYRGGSYFAFAEPLLRAYLAYENLAERRGWSNLATHYLLVATR